MKMDLIGHDNNIYKITMENVMTFKKYLESSNIEESTATGTQGGIKIGADVSDALKKILGADDNAVRAALMTALDNDEQLVNDVINKVGSELIAFLPQVLGKNA